MTESGAAAETLERDPAQALGSAAPSVVVLPAVLRMFAPTHRDPEWG
ncbi:hypothetical protein [Streptomyces aurantiogriseus]|nr:hypothetical protein [Streptomyces aurantiogriseus]